MARSSRAHEVDEVCARARAAWPDVKLDPATFAAFLEQTGGSMAELYLDDLYLACACARGDVAAIARVEEQCVRELDPALAAFERSGIAVDEIKQVLRARLFVGVEGRPPRIAAYGGLSDLRSWIKVVALRLAISLGRKHWRELALGDEAIGEAAADAPSPELSLIKETYRSEFKSAFEAAFGSLSPRERNLLRHQVVDRLSIDRIGALYGVHRATAARWVARARDALVSGVKREMQARLRISSDELESILRLVQSQIEVSLRAFLSRT